MKKYILLIFILSLFLLSGCVIKENTNHNINNVTSDQSQSFEKPDESNNDEKIYSELKEELLPLNELYITNVIENSDTYTLQGVIYTKYIFTYDEFKEIENDGYMQLNDKKFILTEPEDTEFAVYSLYEENEEIDGYPYYSIVFSDIGVYYLRRDIAQVSACYRITDVYKQITIDKNILCTDTYTEETKTAKEIFTNYEYYESVDSTLPLPLFNFKFENGKCSEILVFNGI